MISLKSNAIDAIVLSTTDLSVDGRSNFAKTNEDGEEKEEEEEVSLLMAYISKEKVSTHVCGQKEAFSELDELFKILVTNLGVSEAFLESEILEIQSSIFLYFHIMILYRLSMPSKIRSGSKRRMRRSDQLKKMVPRS